MLFTSSLLTVVSTYTHNKILKPHHIHTMNGINTTTSPYISRSLLALLLGQEGGYVAAEAGARGRGRGRLCDYWCNYWD